MKRSKIENIIILDALAKETAKIEERIKDPATTQRQFAVDEIFKIVSMGFIKSLAIKEIDISHLETFNRDLTSLSEKIRIDLPKLKADWSKIQEMSEGSYESLYRSMEAYMLKNGIILPDGYSDFAFWFFGIKHRFTNVIDMLDGLAQVKPSDFNEFHQWREKQFNKVETGLELQPPAAKAIKQASTKTFESLFISVEAFNKAIKTAVSVKLISYDVNGYQWIYEGAKSNAVCAFWDSIKEKGLIRRNVKNNEAITLSIKVCFNIETLAKGTIDNVNVVSEEYIKLKKMILQNIDNQ